MKKEIKGIIVKVYDRFATVAERQQDLETNVVDVIISDKKDKTKLLGIKF